MNAGPRSGVASRGGRGSAVAVEVVVAEVPGQLDQLALGVAVHPLLVPPELGVVRREQHQAGVHPDAEVVDDLLVAVVGADVPVGRDRAQVDDRGMRPRWLRWGVESVVVSSDMAAP